MFGWGAEEVGILKGGDMHNKGRIFSLVFLIIGIATVSRVSAENPNERDERLLNEFVVSCEQRIERLKKNCPKKTEFIKEFSSLCNKATYLEGDPAKMATLAPFGMVIDQFEKNPKGCGE